jgi:hypothetical protein
MIEEIHDENDEQLQSSFQIYDVCSGIREFLYLYIGVHLLLNFDAPGGPDECQVAADIYQCGRDLAPTITDDIFTRYKGNATTVIQNIFYP